LAPRAAGDMCGTEQPVHGRPANLPSHSHQRYPLQSTKFRRACVAVISLSIVSLGIQAPAHAGIVGTADAVSATQRLDHRGAVMRLVARADVREQMLALGVNAVEVEGRIAALTDSEVETLAAKIDSAPAGSGALVIVGIVFVVLMILEFTGVIDIFKRA
jgi:hypothetical protein